MLQSVKDQVIIITGGIAAHMERRPQNASPWKACE